jgi:putative membrane protein
MLAQVMKSLALALMVTAPALAADQAAPAPGPSDAEIAHIVVTANAVDVDAGKLAKTRTKNSEVKKFAQQMITDHTAVNKQAAALAKKLGVTPQPNPTSADLKKGGDQNVAQLKKLKGDEFDRHYIDHEVAYHQAVLDAIDKVLVPNAQNAELKALIEKVRPAIAAHLEHAKMIQKQLESGSAEKGTSS